LLKENYKLLENSMAVDSGKTSVLYDLINIPRPQGSGFDIGYYEY